MSFLSFIKNINLLIWGFPMIILLMGTHLFFCFRLKWIQKKTLYAIKLSLSCDTSSQAAGTLSSFSSLATTLAATLGTGNIIGVSTSIALGGPGSIFWCWLTGLLGMATSYAECYLSFLFREKTDNGSYIGGPMYFLKNGLHCKILATLFASFALLASYGIGSSTQANAIASTAFQMWHLSPYIIGFSVSIISGIIIIKGAQKIASCCTKLIPFIGFFYIFCCCIILIKNIHFIIPAFYCILKCAFSKTAITGGICGGSLQLALRYGIARGLFTNEAGLGTAGIAAASAKSSSAKRQALISMTATFWDTVVMCAITGLIIVSTLLKEPLSIQTSSSADFVTVAFAQIPYIGKPILSISLIAFAFATILGWSYFGEQAAFYLFGSKGISAYQVGYLVMIFLGSILSLTLVWELCDFINALMAIPNLIGILLLHKKIST